jgi:hypothetical protein
MQDELSANLADGRTLEQAEHDARDRRALLARQHMEADPLMLEAAERHPSKEARGWAQAYRVRPKRVSRTRVVRVPRRANGPAGRPRAQSNRSSAASGDSGSDDGDPAPVPPPAAVEAVGQALLQIVRRRYPEYSWRVRP